MGEYQFRGLYNPYGLEFNYVSLGLRSCSIRGLGRLKNIAMVKAQYVAA